MSPDAVRLTEWVMPYEHCAVNHVPMEIALEFRMSQCDRNLIEYADREKINLRFQNGRVVNFMIISPYDQDWAFAESLDAWIDFQDLIAGDATSDATIGFVSLEEVL